MAYISVTETIDTGEGFETITRIVWVDSPVAPGTDTYLPQEQGESVVFVKAPSPAPAAAPPPPPLPAPPPPPLPAPPPPLPPAGNDIDIAPAPVAAPSPATVPQVTPPTVYGDIFVRNLLSEPDLTDAEIAAIMIEYKIPISQVARVTGLSTVEVGQRFNAATPPAVTGAAATRAAIGAGTGAAASAAIGNILSAAPTVDLPGVTSAIDSRIQNVVAAEPLQDPLSALRNTGIDNSLLQGLLAGGFNAESITNLINNGVNLSSLDSLVAGGAETIQNIANGAFSSVSGAIGGINPNDVATLISQAQGAITGPLTLPAIDPIVNKIESAADALAGNAAQLAAAAAAGAGIVPSQLSAILKTQSQATLQARNKEAAAGDWRVRIQLAPGATYLYKDAQPGILGPLFDTDGVIFPYTPQIETSYVANYDKYDLVHSNYRGYFYKNSTVNEINIRGTFTAQDTQEANYLLAVIHFFRSVTKMFYGQDSLRGAPPPLVYLSGLGNYQFSGHPCFVASFNYSLPSDVDYIRALAPNNYGTNLISQRTRTGSISSNPFSATLDRITSSNINNAANLNVPSPGILSQNVNNTSGATYVPTKMEINLTLLPTNTRAQVSQQFSLKAFANGSLLKGGFW